MKAKIQINKENNEYQAKTWSEVVACLQKQWDCKEQRESGLYFHEGDHDLPTSGNTGFNVIPGSFWVTGYMEDSEHVATHGEIVIEPDLCGSNKVDTLYQALSNLCLLDGAGEGFVTYDKARIKVPSEHPWFSCLTPPGYEFDFVIAELKGFGVVRRPGFPKNLIVGQEVVEAVKAYECDK